MKIPSHMERETVETKGNHMTKGWLIGGAVLLGALLVAAIVVALLEREEALPEGTPEAAVQRFLKTVEEDDLEGAYGFLSSELKRDCSIEEFFGRVGPRDSRLKNDRITLERTSTVDGTTFVTVRITRFYGSGPFGASESSFEQRFTLRQEEGEWKFTEYPWPYFNCGPFKPEPALPPEPPRPEPTPTATPAPE